MRYKMQNGPDVDEITAQAIHKMYNKMGYSQSLQRINERGGFGWGEVEFMYKELKKKIGLSALQNLIAPPTPKDTDND